MHGIQLFKNTYYLAIGIFHLFPFHYSILSRGGSPVSTLPPHALLRRAIGETQIVGD